MVELDQEKLERSLFINNEGIIQIDTNICSREISPRMSVNMLVFKPDETTLWDDDLYLKICEYHQSNH